ncbi:uncharacterized protein LOC123536889 [Mercenaria mercenaria]|uniref:uncharacterized protein LOC123536889 n=1 Tax=Mercenaria mercenaria TaxID=6596 RepID=UPI00234F676A|nr:uncharacterized protein LOC123536889 [Mercenaria mercenaria]
MLFVQQTNIKKTLCLRQLYKMYQFDGVSSKEHFRKPMDIHRPRSKSEGLVKRSLDFVRVYSDVDLHKTEQHLEAEIRRESCIPPRDKKVARLRLKGERMLHSKFVLLTIVVLNLVDCALVLGELILDIHFIREFRTKSDESSQQFIDTLQTRYPEHLHGHNIDHMDLLYAQLSLAQCHWHDTSPEKVTSSSLHRFLNDTQRRERGSEVIPLNNIHGPQSGPSYTIKEEAMHKNDSKSVYALNSKPWNHTTHSLNHTKQYGNHAGHSGNDTEHSHGDHGHHREHSIWEHVAHGMHKASITILGILFVENFTKLICMGRAFLIKKLEVFDSLVVFISFVVDLVLLKGLMEYRVQDAVFILTFLLPWRVIRVVNSLIVAILDHEHFRLKMLYQEKKAVTAELKSLKAKEKGWDFHLKKIEHFCESEGIPKWKIRQHTAMGRKQSTITTMASLALNGFLKGMVLSPSDKVLLDKSLSLSSQDTPSSLGIISETDTGEEDDLTIVSRQTNRTDSDLSFVTSDESGKDDDDFSRNATVENVHMENHGEEGHVHGIIKNASKVTLKSVTFSPKERKPLIHRQDSVDSRDVSSVDEDDSFTGWK